MKALEKRFFWRKRGSSKGLGQPFLQLYLAASEPAKSATRRLAAAQEEGAAGNGWLPRAAAGAPYPHSR